VLQYVQKNGNENIPDIAASFQKAVVNVLTERAVSAAQHNGLNTIALAGGVACNSALREAMETACAEKNILLYKPAPVYCTDNAAMIACAGYHRLRAGFRDDQTLNADPSLRFGEPAARAPDVVET
jgi:N6-L-threonylcarbamoyladenine synthase